MIFLFTFLSFSLQYYDLSSIKKPDFYVFYLDPLEKVEIIIPTEMIVFIGNWEYFNELYLDVETLNYFDWFYESDDYRIIEYGPFGSKSGLGGIYFRNKMCMLKFVNEGADKIKLPLYFGYSLEKFDHSKINDYYFPLIDNYPENKYINHTDITEPFLFYLEMESTNKPMIAIYAILGVLTVFYLFTLINSKEHICS